MSDYTNPQFWPQLKQLAVNIDGLDYFQILNLPQTATGAEIRTSFYALSRALHPDKFFHITDEDLRAAITKVYKRVTESYTILKEEKKRLKYLADINGPERARKLRFNEESESEHKEQEKLATKVAKTPKGEQMYNAAVIDMQNGRWEAAFKALQSAMLFEPKNEELKRIRDDVDRKRKGG